MTFESAVSPAPPVQPLTPLPLSLCQATTGLAGITGDTHTMEPKLDGFRLQLIVTDGAVKTYTRTEHVATGKLTAVETALADYADVLDGTILDGEAVFITDEGAADFHFTASIMACDAPKAAQRQKDAGKWVSLLAFDILFLQGTDVRDLPLTERRSLLEKIVETVSSPYLRVTEQVTPSDAAHAEFTARYGEGSVIKRLDAAYAPGRSTHNLKWKKQLDEDVVVLGSTPGNGKFEGMVGAVIFGQHTDAPPKGHKCTVLCRGTLHERGQCSGMTDEVRLEMTDRLPVGAVMVIVHNGAMKNGGFRHPQFRWFRFDKAAADCDWTIG